MEKMSTNPHQQQQGNLYSYYLDGEIKMISNVTTSVIHTNKNRR